MPMQKIAKTKLISDDANEFMDSPKPKKNQKRARNEPVMNPSEEEEDISRLIGQYKASAKKKKAEVTTETNKESRQKILNLVSHQLEARKHCNENLFKGLAEITSQVEADYNAMKENEQKLEHLTGTYMKCIQQATTAYKHKLKSLKEIHTTFKKECEEMESNHRAETEKVVDELEYDIKKLQDKLVAETKRSGWESLRRSIFHAMQNDF